MNINTTTPIASVSFKWSSDYYRQFCVTVRASAMFSWFSIVWLAIFAVLLILDGGFKTYLGILLIIFDLFLIWNVFSGISPTAVYKSYKLLQGLSTFVEFFDDKLVITNDYSFIKLPYDMLYAIKSSKYGYAFMASKASGYFVPRELCSDELISFIEVQRKKTPIK